MIHILIQSGNNIRIQAKFYKLLFYLAQQVLVRANAGCDLEFQTSLNFGDIDSYSAVLDCAINFCNDGLKFATLWKYFCALQCLGLLGKL